jgi:anthranilate synthase component 1
MKVGALSFPSTEPGAYIRQVQEQYRSPRFDYLPTFTGELVGYFSYDYLKYADLMLFDKVIAFDHFWQKMILIVNMDLSDPEENYNKTGMELENLGRLT